MPKSSRGAKLALGLASTALLASSAPALAADHRAAADLAAKTHQDARMAAEAGGYAVAAGAAPVCDDQTVEVHRNKGGYASPYCAYDSADGHPTYQVVDRPDNGYLDVNLDSGSFTYTPKADFVGTDSVQFRASNAAGESAVGTLTFNVTAATNTAPYCYGMEGELQTDDIGTYGHLEARKTHGRKVAGGCYDVDGDAMTMEILSAPATGTLTAGTGEHGEPTLTYVPAADATDGQLAEATVRAKDEHGAVSSKQYVIGFAAQAATWNTNPYCWGNEPDYASTFEAGETTPIYSAGCYDPEGDPVTLAAETTPANAALTVADGMFKITPSATSGGSSFEFSGTDAPPAGVTPLKSLSNGVTHVKYAPAHADPACSAGSLATTAGTRGEFEIACSDADGDETSTYLVPVDHSSYRIAGHGDIEYRNLKDGKLRFTYIPDAGFSGTDTFAVHVWDEFDYAVSKISVTVNPTGTGSGTGTGTGTGTAPAPTSPAPAVTPEQAKAAMTTLLTTETLDFLRGIAKLNKKGIVAKKPVLSLGSVGSEQLPNGGTARFGVYDKPAAKKATASAKRKKKRLSLGTTTVKLAKGQKKTVKVKLNKKGKSLLRKKGKVKLTVDATFTDALTGAQVTKSRTYTFKVKKK